MPRPCSTALAGIRSARSGTTGSPTSTPFGRSSLMNAVVPGSPERALFFPHFLTTCRKLTVGPAVLGLVAAAAGPGGVRRSGARRGGPGNGPGRAWRRGHPGAPRATAELTDEYHTMFVRHIL